MIFDYYPTKKIHQLTWFISFEVCRKNCVPCVQALSSCNEIGQQIEMPISIDDQRPSLQDRIMSIIV